MPTLLLNACCEFIDLRTGTLIIGYLELVSQIIGTIFFLIGLIVGSIVASFFQSNHSSLFKSDLPRKSSESSTDGSTITFFFVFLILALVFGLSFTITLLVGVHKNKRRHVKAYLIYKTVFLVISFIVFYASLSTVKYDTISVVLFIISCALYSYFLLVVRSYYYRSINDRLVNIDAARAPPPTKLGHINSADD